MNLDKVKLIYNALPFRVKNIISVIPFSIFCGKSYREQLSNINIPDYELKSKQEKNWIAYANDCINYVPFYKRFAKNNNIVVIESISQLKLFPVIGKDDLSENIMDFIDPRFLKNSYNVTTGGTTGKQLSLRLSNCTYGTEWAFVNSFLMKNGINPNSKRLCIRGVATIKQNEFIGYNPLYKELQLSPFKMNSIEVKNNFDEISKFDAKWIHGYPSSVATFATILKENALNLPSIKHVLLISEKIQDYQREIIEEVFGRNIITFYGMTERVAFAESVGNKLIPNPLYGILEEINGELVATGFINKTTRLLRYRTGDLAVVHKDDNGFVDEIEEISGRWTSDYLIGISGIKITMTALNIHSEHLKNVCSYQFYQDKVGCCTLFLVMSHVPSLKEINDIINCFQEKVGCELTIIPKIVEKIDLTIRGKHKFIISTL